MITSVLILFLSLPQSASEPAKTAAGVPIESLLPAGALLLIGTDDLKELAERSKTMPMAKILEETEVQAFLKQPRAAIDAFLKKGLEQLKSEQGVEVDAGRVLTTNYRRLFVGLTHVDLREEATDVGFVIGVEPVG